MKQTLYTLQEIMFFVTFSGCKGIIFTVEQERDDAPDIFSATIVTDIVAGQPVLDDTVITLPANEIGPYIVHRLGQIAGKGDRDVLPKGMSDGSE